MVGVRMRANVLNQNQKELNEKDASKTHRKDRIREEMRSVGGKKTKTGSGK